MLTYEKIKNKPRILRSLTGLSPAAFKQLEASSSKGYEQELAQAEGQREKPRQRQPGGGRKATLASIEDKLLFILFYFKFYPIQELLGFLFGLSQPQANSA